MKPFSRWLAPGLALGTVLMVAQGAGAAGFALIEQSVSGLGNAFAGGSADAADPSAVFYNPAAMTLLKGTQATAGAHLIMPHAKFKNEGSTHALQGVTGVGLLGDDGGDGGVNKVVPNLYYVQQLDNLFLGFGMNVPFGMATSYPEDWVGRYHAIDSEVSTLNLNPSIGYKVSNQFSVGAGVDIQYLQAVMSSMIDFGSIFAAAGGLPQRDDGKMELTGESWGYGYNLGALFSFTENERLGIAYRSGISHKVKGEADFTVPGKIQAIITALNTAAPGSVPPFADVDASVGLSLPSTLSLSYYNRVSPTFAVMADVTATGWHVFEELKVEFDNSQPDNVTDESWEDNMRYSLGATWTASDALDLRYGVAFDSSAVPDEVHRTPRIPDNDRIWTAVGAGYRINDAATVDVGYAHLFVKDPKIDKSETFATDASDYYRGGLKGEFAASVDIASIQLTYKF
jgi:long-chain fatty acid transport protein